MNTERKGNPVNTLIMGIGNLLMGDDGLGVHAAQRMMDMDLPPWVTVLDVGMAFLEALPALEKSQRIIILDAMQASGKPGTIYRSTLSECSCPMRMDSLHNFDVFRMLALAQNHEPNDIVVFGVEPENLSWSMDLSPRVAESIPCLIKEVREELGMMDQEDSSLKNLPVEAQL